MNQQEYLHCLHFEARCNQQAQNPEWRAVFKKLAEDMERLGLTVDSRGRIVPKDRLIGGNAR